MRSDYHAGTTWAPVGTTPVVAATGDRFAVNLVSAVTAKGALRFAAYEGNLNAVVFLDFCRRLLHDATGPVFLVLDGHPVHRSNAVKQFASSTDGRLRLWQLFFRLVSDRPSWRYETVGGWRSPPGRRERR